MACLTYVACLRHLTMMNDHLNETLLKLETTLLNEISGYVEDGIEPVNLRNPESIKARKDLISLWNTSLSFCKASKAYRNGTEPTKEVEPQDDIIMKEAMNDLNKRKEELGR